MSRDDNYIEYAHKILKAFDTWPKDQEEMEKFLQLITLCVEKCLKAKKSAMSQVSTKVWLVYVKAYKERYKTEPLTSPKNYTLCKHLVDSLGSETAIQVIQFYLKQNDDWYRKNMHTLSTLVANQNYQSVHTRMKLAIKSAEEEK
jgi:hypothetical protein